MAINAVSVEDLMTQACAGNNDAFKTLMRFILRNQGFTSTDLATAALVDRIDPDLITTVAALPAAASYTGQRAIVTDATTPTLGSTVAGGGAVKVQVFSDGTNWKVG